MRLEDLTYGLRVFIESITAPEDEVTTWITKLRLLDDPPEALVASFAWRSEDGQVASINVWDSPDAIATFFLDRVQPILEVEGPPATKPARHGRPLHAYIRQHDS